MPGRQARMSGSPPQRRSPGCSHSCLTAWPAAPPAGHLRWSMVGRAFGACCFASKLRSPAVRTGRRPHPAQLRDLDPYGSPYVNAYGIPCAADGVPHSSPLTGISPAQAPFGGPVGRKEHGRLAPLRGSGAAAPSGCASRDWSMRRVRVLGRACGPRRLRRQSQA
jgi:hypothetical protein